MARTPNRTDKTTLITGASAGIGEALARQFARAGFNLVLVARSSDKLKLLAAALAKEHGIKAWVAPADLALPGAAQALAAKMKRARRRIDVLVNNAGVLEHGAFVDMPTPRHRELIDLHVTALTESLAEELQGTGVTVTALCPGITATSMLDKAQQASTELGRLPSFVVGTADAVAHEGFEACMQGQVICVPGTLNLATTVAGRATPRWLLRRVSGAVVPQLKPPRT